MEANVFSYGDVTLLYTNLRCVPKPTGKYEILDKLVAVHLHDKELKQPNKICIGIVLNLFPDYILVNIQKQRMRVGYNECKSIIAISDIQMASTHQTAILLPIDAEIIRVKGIKSVTLRLNENRELYKSALGTVNIIRTNSITYANLEEFSFNTHS